MDGSLYYIRIQMNVQTGTKLIRPLGGARYDQGSSGKVKRAHDRAQFSNGRDNQSTKIRLKWKTIST